VAPDSSDNRSVLGTCRFIRIFACLGAAAGVISS
jgi:hypothetical protein